MLKRATAAEPAYEAKVDALTVRGVPYRYFGREFPPGVWVPVTTAEAQNLQFKSGVTTRRKQEGGDGA